MLQYFLLQLITIGFEKQIAKYNDKQHFHLINYIDSNQRKPVMNGMMQLINVQFIQNIGIIYLQNILMFLYI